MRIVITGASGTVGSVLTRTLTAMGITVIPWDRSAVPIDDYAAMRGFLEESKADALFHLAIASTPTGRDNEARAVHVDWVHELAWACRELELPWVLTSTAMVFRDDHNGPHRVDTVPSQTEGYGGQKSEAERVARRQDPHVRIARLGWQIGTTDSGNQMLAWLHEQARHGPIMASTTWKPAASFLDDTAATLLGVLDQPPGTYHIDGNDQGWSFYEIASALRTSVSARWTLLRGEGPPWDQRLLEHHVPCGSIGHRLPLRPPCGGTERSPRQI